VTVGTTTTTYPPATPVPWTAGATVSFGGLSFTLTGTPANADAFTLAPNVAGVGDNRNMQRLAALASAKGLGGTTTYAGAYGELVAGVGQAAHAADSERAAQAVVQDQIDRSRDQVSGVNLDEEAAALQRYQQAYQASAKLMQVAASLLDTILDIARG
jgi:flagellar hook-associated protein 1 FlgK